MSNNLRRAADGIQDASSDKSGRSDLAQLATHEGLPPVKPQGSKNSKIDDLSLAGPQGLPRRFEPHNTWYDERYLKENPWMTQLDETPSFSLAGNFPRTIRWPQKKGNKRPETVEPYQKGESEAAPQVTAAEDQGEEEHEHRQGQDHDAIDFAESPQEEEEIKREKQLNPPRRPALERAETRKQQSQEHPELATPNLRPFNPWAAVRLKYGRPLGEFLGVTVFIFLGISCNLAVATGGSDAGNINTMYAAWGLAVMLGIYIAGGSSGGFLSPVLVIMLSVFRGFPAKRLPSYIFAQVLGAFVGALLAFAVYRDSIINMDGALIADSTGLSMYTQPRGPYISYSTAFFAELLGSAVLGCTILALGDSGNSPPGAGMHALIIGLLITVTTMSLSWTTRGCFNPARDLGPRLAAIAVGYPLESFTAWHNWWVWGGWVAPITGGLIGGTAYDLCVFKGGESPVNFSFSRWRKRSLDKEKQVLRNVFGSEKKARQIERKLESGELKTKESNNQ